MNKIDNNNMIKYIIILGIIYSLLKLVPEQKIEDRDLMLIIVVIIFVFYIVEVLCHKSKLYLQQYSNSNSNLGVGLDLGFGGFDIGLGNSNNNNYNYNNRNYNNRNNNCTEPFKESIKETFTENFNETPKSELPPPPPPQSPRKYESNKSSGKQVVKDVIKTISEPKDNTIAMKYFHSLIGDLVKMRILNKDDIEIMKMKLDNKLLDIEDILPRLEKMKENGTSARVKTVNDDNIYNELDYETTKPIGGDIANNWSEKLGDKLGYTILNTDKWQVPKPRVPNCKPCQTLCPSTYNNFGDLSAWDNTLKITDTFINQTWAKDQVPK